MQVQGNLLLVEDLEFDLTQIGRIVVVGAGKAGAGMASGVESALGPELLKSKRVEGWVNVPDDCVEELNCIHLHGARPAGVNEPTAAGVEGTQRILELIESLQADDLCLFLISGGGSALLPAPHAGITLEEKRLLTNFLSGAGANIQQLNTVRKKLSRVKGGGLLRTCRAGQLVTLIISDVLGDPLDVIASGPTVPDPSSPADALEILDQFDPDRTGISASIYSLLERLAAENSTAKNGLSENEVPNCPEIKNLVIGNNALAVDAAGIEAERRGYSHAMRASIELEGEAESIGRHLAKMALQMSVSSGPDCLITGGEPIVRLVEPAKRGKGGRNQQLVLAALSNLLSSDRDTDFHLGKICILSGGTDGEDGPTDAAGAFVDGAMAGQGLSLNLEADDFLARNDAYHFFQLLDGLIKTGPTHTNVCDLRICVVARIEHPRS